MEEKVEFVYKEEFWFVSAFLNSNFVNGEAISVELEMMVQEQLQNLSVDDLSRIKGPHAEEIKDSVVAMTKRATSKVKWVPYIENFPYTDENTEISYDTLGYFQFEVEYYKDDPQLKEKVTPLMIQQVPIIMLNLLQQFELSDRYEYLNFDTESPMYIYVISNRTKPEGISWSEENIKKYKHSLGYWTEIYSGAWPDYSESLYDLRVQNNLSNRLSELHFIRRNSGFIYMYDENYRNFFGYMRDFVINPTPRIRAILFALISINHSLDNLFLKRHSEGFVDIDIIEHKISNLRYLRGVIQTQLGVFYDELDYNRRQHYTAVLTHLINEFNLNRLIRRISDKFDVIYDTMQELYVKKTEENQAKTERGLNLLNILFGLGVLADFAGVLTAVWAEGSMFQDMLINSIVAGAIALVLMATIFVFVRTKLELKKSTQTFTVDAVLHDGKGNIVFLERDAPPFKGYLSLPGVFRRKGESEKNAITRAIKSKVDPDIQFKIEHKIGTFSTPGRDPRGNIISVAFRCRVTSDIEKIGSKLMPLEKAKTLNLAFDHENIIRSAKLD